MTSTQVQGGPSMVAHRRSRATAALVVLLVALATGLGAVASPTPAGATSGYVRPGVTLYAGQSIYSSAGDQLTMQSDGNLVLYRPTASGRVAAWHTRTHGQPGAYAVMQGDGNLVVYRPTGSGRVAIWNAGTMNNPGAYLELQDDGNLVIYAPRGAGRAAVWHTGTYVSSRYRFQPGHRMNTPKGGCTGSYPVRGSSGSFALTAGHCGSLGSLVSGDSRRFGVIVRSEAGRTTLDAAGNIDAALVRIDPGDTMGVQVVDPVTGRSPGVVVGADGTSALTKGLRIGKMGRTTGWTEGTITGWETLRYPNGQVDHLLCTTATSGPGDSGGPVWRSVGPGQVRAVGIIVGGRNGKLCFEPIGNVLQRFGATLDLTTTQPRGGRVDATTPAPLPGEPTVPGVRY